MLRALNAVNTISALPGINFVAKSVNIAKMNPFQGASDPGLGKDIFTLTYNRGKECIKGNYVLPDAVCGEYVPLENTDYVELAVHAATSSDYQLGAWKETEFEKSVSVQGINIDFLDLSLRSSQEFSFASEFATTHKANIVIKHAMCYDYSVTVSSYIAPDSLGYIELDPEFVQSVKDLPVNGTDLTPYIKWLMIYGTHRIQELTTGAVLTETTYFTEDSYSAALKEVSDVEVAAQESTWFHTTSKSGSYSESAQAATFDKYSYGIQHYSSHGEVPSYDNANGWLDKVRSNPVPIRMSLTPIFDLFTPSWFSDPNISVKQLNLVTAIQNYCNAEFESITGGCYSPPPAPPAPIQKPAITEEILFSNKGGGKTKIIRADNSICFLSKVGAMFSGGEYCKLTIAKDEYGDSNAYWYLSWGSDQDGFLCGARCLGNLNTTTFNYQQDIFQYEIGGSGTHAANLLDPNHGMCFLTKAQAWGDNGSVDCNLDVENGMWHLWGNGYVSEFNCGATCVINRVTTTSPFFYMFSGSGSQSIPLASADDYFCSVSRGRYIYKGGETCYVNKQLIPGQTGDWWVLYMNSQQSAFLCGSVCSKINEL